MLKENMSMKDVNYYQELILEFEMTNDNNKSFYKFYVNKYLESKTINGNNISFEYSATYYGDIYNKDIFNIDRSEANKILSDIESLIIDIIKNLNLNPTIKYKEPHYHKDYSKKTVLSYKISLSFDDSENIISKSNIENIFNSIISILKNRNVDLEYKPLNELINSRKIEILINENLKIKIEEDKKDILTHITYNDRINEKFTYKIEAEFRIGKPDSVIVNPYISYFNYFYANNNYNNYLDLINPKNILNKIINLIIQSKSDIEKVINEYGFNEALKSIDVLVNRNYKEDEIKKIESKLESQWFQKLIPYLENHLKEFIKNGIRC